MRTITLAARALLLACLLTPGEGRGMRFPPRCSEHFCLEGEGAGDWSARLLGLLEDEYAELPGLPPLVRVAVHPDYDAFRRVSGGTGRHAAKWRRGVLHLAPPEKLESRRILRPVLRHELTHLWVQRVSLGRAPRWLAEGVCVWRSGELGLTPPEGEVPSLRAGALGPLLTTREAGDWVRGFVRERGRDGLERLLRDFAAGRASDQGKSTILP